MKPKTIIIEGWEYTLEDIQMGETFSEIKIPKGWSLWTYEDCVKLHNNNTWRRQLNLGGCWFFIKQPFSLNIKNNYVAWFDASWLRADLNCRGDPQYSLAALGVRFKRKVKK